MAEIALILAAVALVIGSLLGVLWLVTRNPALEHRLKAALAENRQHRDRAERLRREAGRHADVNPLAQVFLDELNGTTQIATRKGER